MGAFIDISGKKFNSWTVLYRDKTKTNKVFYKCKCECGEIRSVLSGSLRNGDSKSCGCKNKSEDITGRKFNKLTVIKFIEYVKDKKQQIWNCKCDCGNSLNITRSALINGQLSCGCMGSLLQIKQGNYSRTHGESHSRNGKPTTEYNIFRRLNSICYDEKDKSYGEYGAKGVIICERWQGEKGLKNFIEDMGRKPNKKSVVIIETGATEINKETAYWSDHEEVALRIKKRKGLTSKYKCVHLNSGGKYVARITVNKQRIYLGVFESEKDAFIAVIEATKKYKHCDVINGIADE